MREPGTALTVAPPGLLLAAAVVLGGCAEDPAAELPGARSEGSGAHVIMVVESGFDLAHPVFRDRIEAAYTLDCTGGPDMGDWWGVQGGSMDEKRANLLEVLRRAATQTCTVAPGARPDEHGTGTAGIIAAGNDRARIVAISTGKILDSVFDLETGPCLDQQDVAEQVALLDDPAIDEIVRREELYRDPWTDQLRQLAVQHRVGIVNESFGSPSPHARFFEGLINFTFLLRFLSSPPCPLTDVRPLYAAVFRHEQRMEQYRARHGQTLADLALVVQGAGNGYDQADRPAEALYCHEDRPGTSFAIGASRPTLASVGRPWEEREAVIAEFSTRGACIDYYAPGYLLVPAPAGRWTRRRGTSFAAPIFVRWLSRTYPPDWSPQEIARAVRQHWPRGTLLPYRDFGDYRRIAGAN
jgi:hypothetical protein